MARISKTADGQRTVVQGFRRGGGKPNPYVYVGVLDNNDNLTGEFTLGVQGANELSEFIRQEAEFAAEEPEQKVEADQ